MKMGEQKAIEIFVQAPNERTEWSATRSTPNTQTLRETHRNSNAKLFVSPCVNVCLISLFRVNRICICTNFNLALVNVCTILWIYPKKVLFNGICEGVPYKASAYTRWLTSDAINENCPAFSLFLISSLILSFMSELRPWKCSSLILKRLFVVKRTPDALNTMRIGSLCVPQFYRNWAKTSKDTSKENNASPLQYHSIP